MSLFSDSMNKIQDYFDFSEGLDWFTKYAFIIGNFIIIFTLLLMKKNKKIPQDEK